MSTTTGQVGIDARSLRGGPPGVATYVRNLLGHLSLLDPLESSFPRNNLLWNQLRVPPAQVRRRWKVYHAAAYTAPLVNFCPLVVTAHDISYLTHPEWYPNRVDLLRRAYYVASLKRADRILTPSRFSLEEIAARLPAVRSKLRCTPLGVAGDFFQDTAGALAVKNQFQLPNRFLLHVGDLHQRRNLPLMVQVARRLDIPLVLVGRLLERLDLPETRVRLLSGLTVAELRGVYNAAAVLLYPSLYEGFGLPLLEAMACGTPVVAARRSCLPEVCGDSAFLVEPEVAAFAQGVDEVLDDPRHWVEAGLSRAAQFTWARTAQLTLEVYRELHPELE